MNIKKSIALFLLILGASSLLQAQNINPKPDEIFKEDEVIEIRMAMSALDKETLHAEENKYADIYMSTNVTFSNSELADELIPNVGVRLRGNTARDHNKRSYKINFKEFGGEKFEGYKKLNLKPDVNDPTMIRELLTMHLFREMGVPAPLVAPAALYINGEYMGAYLLIEQIDDEFVDERFGHEEGFLYKCAYSTTLESPAQASNDELFDSKMNESTDTRAELKNFINVLNNTRSENFQTEIEEVFDVDRFLRYLAVEAITGHWDGYSYLCNNYYLFYDGQTGLMEFIAYDTDNTWGIDWVDRDWANRDLTHFHRNNVRRPLVTKIFSVPQYNNQYIAYLHQLFDYLFTEAYLYPKFDELETLLAPLVANDTYFDDSFGFTSIDFSAGFDYSSKLQAKYGLRDYVETRRASGINSIPEVVLSSSVSQNVKIYPNPSRSGQFQISYQEDFNPRVFSVSGKEVSLTVTSNQRGIISFQIPDAHGIYLLHLNGTVYRLMAN